MKTKRTKTLLTALIPALLGALPALAHNVTSKAGIPLVIPPGPEHSAKIDFAELEHRFPIPSQALSNLTVAEISGWTQEELDQLYARLPSGPLPGGIFEGTVIVTPDRGIGKILEESKLLKVAIDSDKLEALLESMWKGKRFYKDQGLVRNRVPLGTLKQVKFLFRGKVKLPKGKNTDLVEQFPGKVYCGQSLLDSRRESVVIDYAWASRLPGYQPQIDYLTTREGFRVRDELRMVRPGFYLGRAYLNHGMFVNFTLTSDEAARAGKTESECWRPS